MRAAMIDYAIFGGTLRSALEFPSLRAQPAARPTWTLRVRAPEGLRSDAVPLGADQVDGAATVQLHRSSDGWHLVYDDTGRFDIDASGREITWRAGDDVSEDAARLDVMGRVLAMAVHAAGGVCFHASAVAMGDEAIAFVGGKGVGKSTLAWALVRAGARLITDDTLRVQLETPPLAYPGVHELRLRPDAATRLPPDAREAHVASGRLVVDELDVSRLQAAPVPLAAMYLLVPVTGSSVSVGARVSALPPVPSALSLVRHAKVAPLLTGSEAVRLLDRVIALARRTPVRLLEVPRDFARLDDVVADVMARHADGVGTLAR